MDAYILDTNIISYWFAEGRPEHEWVVKRIESLPKGTPLWISVVTLGEIVYGYNLEQSRDVSKSEAFKKFVSKNLPYVKDVDTHTASEYGRLRAELFDKYRPDKKKNVKYLEELIDPVTEKTLRVDMNDVWIAAHALQFNFTLVTNDKMRHIQEVAADLRVENWARQ